MSVDMSKSLQIELKNVTKAYESGETAVKVLDHFSLTIPQGDFLAVTGPSGVGKSTLLNLIGGLDRPTEGSVMVGADRIDRKSASELAAWRATAIGFVFQYFHLLPMLTAGGNVELPLLLTSLRRADRRVRIAAALKLAGIDDLANRRPREMSGGQQQRVAIARAIVSDPPILLCDEPTGNLDRTNADQIMHLLQILNRELGKTVVMVTHDAKAASFATRQLHLDKDRSDIVCVAESM